nr:N-alpha-acetyltransferase 30 [Onthophagus taurus]
MNKVKPSVGKKCATTNSNQQALKKNELNIEDQLEKLNIKQKNVNGLLNGIDHKTETKTTKKDKRVHKDDKLSLIKDHEPLINTKQTEKNSVKYEHEDITVCDLMDMNVDSIESGLTGTKCKAKTKRTDSERSVASTSSSKGDSKCKLEDIESLDFDITAYIKGRYGDRKEEEKELEKEKVVEGNLEEKSVQLESDGDKNRVENPEIQYVQYDSELQMPMIMKIIQKDLSEPYSIYTYRYFIHNWPNLCFLAMYDDECVGAIVCKLDVHRKLIKRGYIAMLAVDKRFRKHGIGSTLVRRAIEEMIAGNADEVVLETEITNKPALRLYEALGFVRDKRLFRYYLNGVDALRLKLWLR